MLATLPELSLFLTVACAVIVGGVVKGAFGIGFPAVAMSILPLFVPPALAVTILALPIVVTNIQQLTSYPDWRGVVRRFWVAGATGAVTILIVSQFLDDAPAPVLAICIGAALVIFALTGLFKLNLRASDSLPWQVGVGLGSGVIGGLTAIKAPTMIYTAALDLPRDMFVATAGFLFLSTGVGLLTGLFAGSMLDAVSLPLSVAAVVAAMLGFKIGEAIRHRLNPALFRKLLLWLMLLLGLRMIAVNLV